jgi:hypothetical protein
LRSLLAGLSKPAFKSRVIYAQKLPRQFLN